jgi:hypothetical protein
VEMMHHRRRRYIGLDVHRATIALALAEEEGSPGRYGDTACHEAFRQDGDLAFPGT